VTTKTELLADHSLDTTRSSIARLVPEAMDRAIASYRDFVALETPLDAKGFKEHHTAGRTALAQLEALVRLARWAALPNSEPAAEDPDDDFDTMLSQASRALAVMRGDAT